MIDGCYRCNYQGCDDCMDITRAWEIYGRKEKIVFKKETKKGKIRTPKWIKEKYSQNPTNKNKGEK